MLPTQKEICSVQSHACMIAELSTFDQQNQLNFAMLVTIPCYARTSSCSGLRGLLRKGLLKGKKNYVNQEKKKANSPGSSDHNLSQAER